MLRHFVHTRDRLAGTLSLRIILERPTMIEVNPNRICVRLLGERTGVRHGTALGWTVTACRVTVRLRQGGMGRKVLIGSRLKIGKSSFASQQFQRKTQTKPLSTCICERSARRAFSRSNERRRKSRFPPSVLLPVRSARFDAAQLIRNSSVFLLYLLCMRLQP